VISFPIIDAHVHLCDPDVMSYGWMADAPDLNRQVLPRDLADAAMPVEVERLVFVEVDVDPPQHLQEAAWVADLARDYGFTDIDGSIPDAEKLHASLKEDAPAFWKDVLGTSVKP
jgi:predicted TIM-barrel fold metal-dependent hydrolase